MYIENTDKSFYSFNDYLKEKYNCKVYRLPINAGLTCPNRINGGTGCIFCDEEGSGATFYPENISSIAEQVKYSIDLFTLKRKAKKFYVYFQSFTNTFAPVEELKKIYDSALIDDRIAGIIIGTRPDCVDDEKIKMIKFSYSDKYDVWIELGLQSAHNSTLKFINRGHSVEDFVSANEICLKYDIKTTAHIIIGLPYETEKMMLETGQFVANQKCAGIKIHSLYIIKNTVLHKFYEKEKFKLLTMDEYARITAEILKMLPDKTVIHRITGETDKVKIVAPDWVNDKNSVICKIKHFYNFFP